MAVPEQTPYIEHTGNGITTSFALGFQCETKDHLIVLIDDIEPPIATWSLTGGDVVFTTAPAAGKKITLQRNTPFSRNTDYQSYNNSFRPPAVNKDFDWIWLKLQELGVADWILSNRIDALKKYVDDRDDELRAYLMEEIRKQGVALDQLDEYYNYLMERLAQIAVDKGWDSSFVVHKGKTQYEINEDQKAINETNTRGVKNIEDLRKFKGSKNNQRAQTLEYTAGSGYGGALYQWDSSSNADDDGFSVIAVTGVSTGRWKLVIKDRVLKATQAGVIADLFSTDKVNQLDRVQKCVDYMSKIGGGVVQLPTGHIYAKIVAKANVEIRGTLSPYVTTETDVTMSGSRPIVNNVKVTHGTFLHSTGSTDTIYIGENIDNVKIRNLELKPERQFDTGLCGFGIRHAGKNGVFENLKGEGFRFEPMYVRGKDDPNHRGGTCVNTKILNCEFGNSARNSFALIYCSDVYIKNCDFYQTDTSVAWVYLWDIEPNPSTTDTVYNVTVDNCTFNAINRSGAEPTVIVKELNTPNGTPNVKFLNCKFKGTAVIRNNCAIGWKDCVVDNCEFEGRAFSTTTNGYIITSGRFTNNRMYGTTANSFAFNTNFGGDFIIEGNIFDNISFTGANLTGATFGLNQFTGSSTVVDPVDRRTLTQPYREKTLLEIVNPTGGLAAYNTVEVRQVNLTTTSSPILTAKNRSTSIITIAAADASSGGSIGLIELVISSDDTSSTTFATDKINGAAGITYSWNGRTLSLATKAATANQWIVKVETFAASSNQKMVTWLA